MKIGFLMWFNVAEFGEKEREGGEREREGGWERGGRERGISSITLHIYFDVGRLFSSLSQSTFNYKKYVPFSVTVIFACLFCSSQRQNFASCLLQRNPSALQAVGLVFHVLRTPDLEGKTLTEKTMKRNGEAEGVCGGGGGGGEGVIVALHEIMKLPERKTSWTQTAMTTVTKFVS